jgi:hypothetical protein
MALPISSQGDGIGPAWPDLVPGDREKSANVRIEIPGRFTGFAAPEHPDQIAEQLQQSGPSGIASGQGLQQVTQPSAG